MTGEKPLESLTSSTSGLEFDPGKLITVITKYWYIYLLLIFLSNTIAYLIIRYTKPLFRSTSELKLDIKSEASTLGLYNAATNDPFTGSSNLSAEVELLKSRLFLGKVVDAIGMDISVYAYGKMLVDERYPNPPFRIDYTLRNNYILDRSIDIIPIDRKHFELSYNYGSDIYTGKFTFGEKGDTPHFSFIIDLAHQDYSFNPDGYFFRINSREALINYLERNLEVLPVKPNANIISVSLSDFNKYKAADLVNAIDTLYLKYTEEQRNKANEQKINFLDEQISVNNKRLNEIEAYFENFTITNRSVDVQADIQQTITILNRIDSARLNVANQLKKLDNVKLSILNDSIQYTYLLVSNTLGSAFYQKLEDYVNQFKQLEQLKKSYSSGTRAITIREEKLLTLRSELITFIELRQNELVDRLSELQKERKEIENSFTRLPSQSNELTKIRREYTLYEGFNLTLMQRKAELEIAQAGMVTDFKILSPASTPSIPISPNKLIIYGIGFSTGLVLVLVFMIFFYVIDNKIHSIKEIEAKTDVPVIGTIPKYNDETLKNTQLVISKSPRGLLAESLRTIRTNLDFLPISKENMVISVTSTVPGEGKTFCSVNLAGVLSLANDKVVIVDMDMRKPRIHQAFNDNEATEGLSTYLIHKSKLENIIKPSVLENLFYIPAGPVPPNPSELIVNEVFDAMINRLKEQFDYIFLDTPPVGLVTDGILAMRKADLALYVTREGYTQTSYIGQISRLKSLSKIDNLYILLNSAKPTRGYGYIKGKKGYYYQNSKA